ncbi:MAG: 23S rRNA (adenine(2503)-C(2))-methyltransferase RlmN [Candidatus Jacksonbacteria bacterium]
MSNFIQNSQKLIEALKSEPAFRLKQCRRAMYSEFIDSWEQAKNLPNNLREKLSKDVPLSINGKLFESKNKATIKALLTLEDGEKIETVLMRHKDGRNTVCVSSQAGCGMKCDFCATGQLGLRRNLFVDEIIDQALFFARYLKGEKQRVSNVVFMGMGEPMLNFENVMEVVKILNDDEGFNIGARRISISTCGIAPGIKKLERVPLQLNLAISLHAANDQLRDRLMPVNKSCDINKLMNALKNYIQNTNRKVMIEYVLLGGVNDSVNAAKELADLLKSRLKTLFMVNLIKYNETGRYRSPDHKSILNFKRVLENKGVEVSLRYRFGHDIKGACGQLTAQDAKRD